MTIRPQEYQVALKELPTTQFYLDLLNALASEMSMKLDIKIVPSARADYLVTANRVDMDVPVLDVEDFARSSIQYPKYERTMGKLIAAARYNDWQP